VYSHDEFATQYAALTAIQAPRQEIIEDMFHFVKVALTNFFKKHRAVPQRIIFYRDGVSEGEFQSVAEREVEAVKGKNISCRYEFISLHLTSRRHQSISGRKPTEWSPNRIDLLGRWQEARPFHRLCGQYSDHIAVKIRHHSLFFSEGHGNRIENCPPGTLVDTGIVHPGQFPNFYLQSHAAIKGST